MKISGIEKQFLINKYKSEGYTKMEISRRINELESFEDFVKFSKVYLKCKI